MIDLLELQKDFILKHLKKGGVAVDFTMGNGHDTEFLCRTVGEEGRVYAFDIQEKAVMSAGAHLASVGVPSNYTLINDSHHNVKKYVDGEIDAGMFNLGYLPGGDKRITTMRETTMPAVEAAVSMLKSGGVITVAVYPGHEEGALEGAMITEYLSRLQRSVYCATEIKILNSPTSPYFIVIERK